MIARLRVWWRWWRCRAYGHHTWLYPERRCAVCGTSLWGTDRGGWLHRPSNLRARKE